MTKKVLIVGLGMGALYQRVCEELGWFTVTIDSDKEKNPDYTDITLLPQRHYYDMAIIATPNNTHASLATALASKTDRIVVEKPGCGSSIAWHGLRSIIENVYDKRLFLVRNSAYRSQLPNIEWLLLFPQKHFLSPFIKEIQFNFLMKDRVPGPGSWFTTQEQAFGGSCHDLMPHVISMAQTVFHKPFISLHKRAKAYKWQRYSLDDVDGCTWGQYVPSGTYNVDDSAYLETDIEGINVKLAVAWKMEELKEDLIQIRIKFVGTPGGVITYDLGLCPEKAYKRMLTHYMQMSDTSYRYARKCDLAIHHLLDSFVADSQCLPSIHALI